MTRELFEKSLPGKRWQEWYEKIDFIYLADSISLCMADHDQTMGLPIYREELLRAREGLLYLQRLLEAFISRVGDDRQAVLNALKQEYDPQPQMFYQGEADGMSRFIIKLQNLHDGLKDYLDLFHVDLVRSKHWHSYAFDLFWAFTAAVPPFSPDRAWGVSPKGPAVLFIQKALGEILTYRKVDGETGLTFLTASSVADAISKQRAMMRAAHQAP